jgi:hypothetical protein
MPSVARVAFGLRAHSGWAALVALRGPASAPAVVDRRRLLLCDESFPRQPYHAAEPLSPAKAEALVSRSRTTAARLAREGLEAALAERRAAHETLAGAGLLLGSARPLPATLAAILRSHPLIHSAEGELYRDVLRAGCDEAGVTLVGVRERDAVEQAAERLALTAAGVRARLLALGRPLGPPWTQDEKLAALAAWLVLSGAKGPSAA